jgi:hypothetical protein
LRLKITLPSELKLLPSAKRSMIVDELMKALDAKPTPSVDKEHNVWAPNDEPLMAAAEEELYEILIASATDNMAILMAALGLTDQRIDLGKAIDPDFYTYTSDLIKSDTKRTKLTDLWELAKTKRQGFMKYLQGGNNWSKQKLKEIEDILKQKLPNYGKIAEEYAVRAAFIAKIRDKADTEALETLGAYVDRFPSTIAAATKEGIQLTARPQRLPIDRENTSVVVTEAELGAARKEWQQIKILPLQPQEIRTVENAELRTGAKLSEVSDRHRASIKQLILQAINGRWSAQQLAQALFDNFGDQNRDWRRVAITELAMASNDAFLAGCSEGDTVWIQPVEGSCKHCKQYLEGKSFTVTSDTKLMGHNHEQEMKYVWTGKTNFGRKVATYVPCVPLHPHCRHRYQKVSRFYSTDVTGKPTLKPVNQLIQEERARRGLPPDPNLN